MRIRIRKIQLLFIVLLGLIAVGAWGVFRSLPSGINDAGAIYAVDADDVTFLRDITYLNEEGERVSEQEIFDAVIELVAGAEKYILVDMFLFNDFQGAEPELHRALSSELTNALIEQKNAHPAMDIVVVSDPINTVYGGQRSEHFEHLREADIPVVVTDLSALRDSNPAYSALWRTFFQWLDPLHARLFGEPYTFRFMPNPLDSDGPRVTVRSYMNILNFKANHRKLITADTPEGVVSIVTSANPHDGSSAHSNIALRVAGDIAQDIIRSERAIVQLSDRAVTLPEFGEVSDGSGTVEVQFVTERAIKEKALSMIASAGEGDSIDMVMFYLADADIIDALIAAFQRGVSVRVVLDPNKDAFGREKNGVPNRPVAGHMVEESGSDEWIRWCDTHGEQCHSKMLLVRSSDIYQLLLGSANFTRRNVENLNLEADIYMKSRERVNAIADAYTYMDRIWNNDDGYFTVAYGVYQDEGWPAYVLYWWMEHTGMSSF